MVAVDLELHDSAGIRVQMSTEHAAATRRDQDLRERMLSKAQLSLDRRRPHERALGAQRHPFGIEQRKARDETHGQAPDLLDALVAFADRDHALPARQVEESLLAGDALQLEPLAP
jgi:hypothetical protein